MMDHSEQLLDIMDSSFLEHKDSALAHHNSMSYHMDGVGTINLTSSSPLLTGASGNASYVPYAFLDHGDAGSSPSSPLTDHSSSDNDIPLSPQNDHPFSEALGDNSLFLQIPTTATSTGVVPSATTATATNVSSSSLPVPSSTRSVVAATPAPSSTTDGKRKRKAAAPVASSSSSSIKSGNTRATKGRRTDGKKEAATAATKSSSTSVKKASATPTPTSKPSSIRTTRSGTRTTTAPSPLVPNTRGGRDEDKTSASESSSSSIDIALPSLEAIPNDQSLPTPPPHMVAAMGNLAVMGAVTLAQPEYERMLAEEERTKEKKLRKAEQARISRQKKKDRMTLLEESVAMYKQQIAHLQSLPAAVAAPAAPVVPATPVPVTNAERKSSVSPVWNGSSNSSSSDDARSVQSGDDSSSSSSGSSIAPSPSHAPVASVNKQEADVPAVTAPAVCVEDEVNGEAIQRCIQTIITSSYPAASPAGSPNGSTISGYGLMATGSVHAGVDSKEQSHSNAAADQLNANIQGLFDMFAKRQRVTESHLESLDKLLVPSMPLRFLEWSLTQNDKFYSDPNGLWHCLWSKTLSLTPEQMTALHALRNDVSAQRAAEAEIRMQALNMTGIVVSPTPTTTTSSVDGTMATAITTSAFPVASISPKSLSLSSTLSLQAAYSQLSALSRLHLQASNRWLRTLATILTPLQVARYFEWVNIYGHICVQINV